MELGDHQNLGRELLGHSTYRRGNASTGGRYAGRLTGRYTLVRFFCLGLVVFFSRSGLLRGQDSAPVDPPANTVWEISSRHLGDAGSTDLNQLQVRQVQERVWTESSVKEFVQATDAAVVHAPHHTVFYVHGNWTSSIDARKRGWMVYRSLAQRTEKPIRFIIFSWDSERHSGFARDVRDKRAQLNLESIRLAEVLRRVPKADTVGMLGFSFGAAVISGAIHLDAGGTLGGKKVGEPVERSAVYASFLAPAFNRTELGPNGDYRLAATQSKTILNLFNSADPILKRFRFINRKESPIAAGYQGLPQFNVAADDDSTNQEKPARILQVDCANQVGRTHAELAYYQECSYFSAGLNNLLGLQR